LVNVDFEDVKTVMSEPGKAMMGTAMAAGPDRAAKAAEGAVTCKLLEGIDLSGARGVLVLIAASRGNFKLSEVRSAMATIGRYAAPDAHIIYGTAYDESLGDQLRVTVIATGLTTVKRAQAPLTVVQPQVQPQQVVMQPQQVQPAVQTHVNMRTGTDNLPILNHQVGMAPPAAAPAMPGEQLVPSVWRTGRMQAAAKVEALSSNGMEEIEIPAFLRKQAD
jgi:cell division protein FtsZ